MIQAGFLLVAVIAVAAALHVSYTQARHVAEEAAYWERRYHTVFTEFAKLEKSNYELTGFVARVREENESLRHKVMETELGNQLK